MRISAGRKAVNSLIVGALGLVGVVLVCLYFGVDAPCSLGRHNGPMVHEAYVWQREWTEDVRRAIERAESEIGGFTALAAEVSFMGGGVEKVVRVDLDYDCLLSTKSRVGLALRIGPYSGPFEKENDVTKLLLDLAGALVADACEAGLEPVELQIDFDCAESKLEGYRKWVEAFAGAIEPVPVVITALPSWLNRRAFKSLAKASDGFVLQVHSLERPKGPDADLTLCDSDAAIRWAEQAARIGVGFRVALPTYGYIVAFDKGGKFIGLSAEGPSRSWGEGVVLRAVRADPEAMGALVKSWERDRPGYMEGIIWYRLPVDTDRMNWKWATLSDIIAGRAVSGDPKIVIEYPEEPKRELIELSLENRGSADISPMIHVDIECDRSKLVSGDGLRGFVLAEKDARHLALEYRDSRDLAVLAPQERWKVGWLRFSEDTEISVNAEEINR